MGAWQEFQSGGRIKKARVYRCEGSHTFAVVIDCEDSPSTQTSCVVEGCKGVATLQDEVAQERAARQHYAGLWGL